MIEARKVDQNVKHLYIYCSSQVCTHTHTHTYTHTYTHTHNTHTTHTHTHTQAYTHEHIILAQNSKQHYYNYDCVKPRPIL